LKGQRGEYMPPVACPAGTAGVGPGHNTTQCSGFCEAGYYCPAGSTSLTEESCPAGTYNPNPGGTSASNCQNCAPGSFTASAGLPDCTSCEGNYQNETGATGCRACTVGSYCETGASTPKPCPAGTKGDGSTTMDEADDCITCAAGTSCILGEESECSPGSYSASAQSAKCDMCAAGEYQDESGGTACKECSRGNYCPAGSSYPIACPRGSSSNVTRVVSDTGCTPVRAAPSAIARALHSPARG